MNNNFCNNLKYLREQKNISYQYIADKIGVSRPIIAYWEKGKADPTMGNLVKLADVLNVDIVSLINDNLTKEQPADEIVKIPIISKNDDVIDYTYIKAQPNDEYFALKINQDSFKYQSNDLVIFKKTNDYRIIDNNDCLIEINNNRYFFNITTNEYGIIIIPLNDKPIPEFYSVKKLKENNFKLIGIAIEKRKKL